MLFNLSKLLKPKHIKFVRRYSIGDILGEETVTKREDHCKTYPHKGLVLGLYRNFLDPFDEGKFTPTAERYNQFVCNRLKELLAHAGPPPSKGEVRIFYNLDKDFHAVALVGVGKECAGYDAFEQLDTGKEAIRIAAARGSQALQELRLKKVCVESFGHAESAAEGSALGVWLYQEMKEKRMQIYIPQLELHDDCDWTGWQIGLQKAAAQNLARQLMDTPSCSMTPTSFAQNAVEVLCKSGVNVEVKVRGWAESQKMGAFLAAAQGSCEPPIFLELSYYGCARDERPVVLIGKGITYGGGGLCLEPSHKQYLARGEMSGAACVVAACRAVAGLQLPLNIRGLIPLLENMPGCAAMRPGDIVKCMNGKSIRIESTRAAGRISLADALTYAQHYWPRFILDVGDFSRCCRKGFGQACSCAFTNSDPLWEYMLAASMHTGDRVWRLPLWNHFTTLLTPTEDSDIKTNGRGRIVDYHYAGACKCAAFLREFVPCGDWIHLDTAGTTLSNGYDFAYLRDGMSGRPTRTLIEFLSQLVCNRAN